MHLLIALGRRAKVCSQSLSANCIRTPSRRGAFVSQPVNSLATALQPAHRPENDFLEVTRSSSSSAAGLERPPSMVSAKRMSQGETLLEFVKPMRWADRDATNQPAFGRVRDRTQLEKRRTVEPDSIGIDRERYLPVHEDGRAP